MDQGITECHNVLTVNLAASDGPKHNHKHNSNCLHGLATISHLLSCTWRNPPTVPAFRYLMPLYSLQKPLYSLFLHGYASLDHHKPTIKQVVLNNVTGSITFSTASFMSAYVLRMNLLSSVKSTGHQWPTLVSNGKCYSSSTVPGIEHRVCQRISAPQATLMQSWSF